MNTLTFCDGSAPAENSLRNSLSDTRTPWGEGREVEEVAGVLRQVPQLLLRDVGRDLGLARIDEPRVAHHRHRLGVHEVRRDAEVEAHGLSDQNLDGFRLRLELGDAHRDLILARPQSGQREACRPLP